MKKWCKILISTLAAVFMLGSVACDVPGDDSQSSSSGTPNPPSPVDVIGLTGNVGIDRTKFDTEVLYSEPQQADYVFNATEHGVTADDGNDDSAALQSLIEEIRELPADKTKVIRLPAGRLDFIELKNPVDYQYGLVVDGIDNLSIVGDNTEIVVWGTIGFFPFQFTRCKNLLFKGISVDWGNLPFVMGTVESFDLQNKKAVVKVNDNYELDGKTPVFEYLEYDQNTNAPLTGGNFLHNEGVKMISSTKYLENHRVEMTFDTNVSEPPVGTKVALCFTMRFNTTFFVNSCENFKMETVKLYASPGMGLLARGSKNLYFNALRIICRPDTDRLMTTTSDMMHLKGNLGEIVITNSQLENGYDDAVNVCANYLCVYKKDGNKVTVCSPGGLHETYKPVVGEKMEIIEVANASSKGFLTVKTVTLAATGYELTFEEELGKLAIGDYLAMGDHTVSFTMKNSVIRNKRNRGLLIQTKKVLIEDCVFANIQHGSLLVASDLNGSIEGVIPEDITVRNCKFYNNNAFSTADIIVVSYIKGGYGEAGTIKNVLVENNFFAYSRSSVLDLKGVSNVVFKNNKVYLPALSPYMAMNNCAFNLMNVSQLKFVNNEIEHSKNIGYAPVFVMGNIDPETLVVEKNKNLDRSDFISVTEEYNVKHENVTVDWDSDSLDEFNGLGTPVNMSVATTVEVDKVELDAIASSDFSADTRMLWDDTGIYVAFSVTDDEVSFNTSQFWMGDGLEFFLTDETAANDDLSTVKLDGHDTMQLFVWAAEGQPATVVVDARTSEKALAGKDKIKARCWLTDTGYAGKFYIPFEIIPEVKKAVDAGRQVSLSVNYGESDPVKGAMFKTVSCVEHPTSINKLIPSSMTKFNFIKGK